MSAKTSLLTCRRTLWLCSAYLIVPTLLTWIDWASIEAWNASAYDILVYLGTFMAGPFRMGGVHGREHKYQDLQLWTFHVDDYQQKS